MATGNRECYFVTPSHPRIVDGVPTNNPRYLQRNLFKNENQESYLAKVGARLFRKISHNMPVHFPVNAVLPGRRNNPAERDKGIRPLSVYNPIHYQEIPELFMDFICSPVSYTHLDVYKRQCLHRLTIIPMNTTNFWKISQRT